jgi:hypothetical protein
MRRPQSEVYDPAERFGEEQVSLARKPVLPPNPIEATVNDPTEHPPADSVA